MAALSKRDAGWHRNFGGLDPRATGTEFSLALAAEWCVLPYWEHGPSLIRTDTESTLRANDEAAPRLHRSKRRKISDDNSERNVPAFTYGYFGQTVPGQLNMEIVSCDGGEYPTRDHMAMRRENYRAENVLKDDKSVYCTENSRCNLLLRHRDETIFHLDSLTIRAPETGYTAP